VRWEEAALPSGCSGKRRRCLAVQWEAAALPSGGEGRASMESMGTRGRRTGGRADKGEGRGTIDSVDADKGGGARLAKGRRE
jgi:hypothetical protein